LTLRRSDIALSLVLHNEEMHIPRLAASLLRQTLSTFKTFVTDNNSTDNSVSQLRELLPDADIYLSKQNLGFAAAHNRNMRRAFSEGVEAVFILNTDVEIEDNAILVINDFLSENSEAGVVAPIVFYGNSDGKTNIVQSYRINADFKRGRITPVDDKSEYSTSNLPESVEVNYVTGTAFVIRKEVFELTGELEESGFLYGEEMDFCYRASLNGIRMVALRDAKVWHYHDWSKKNGSGLNREYYYINRNRVLFFKRHNLKGSLFRFVLNEVLISPLRIRWALRAGGKSLVKFFYLGILHGLKGYSGRALNIKGLMG